MEKVLCLLDFAEDKVFRLLPRNTMSSIKRNILYDIFTLFFILVKMVKVELKMYKTLKQKVKNFVHLDENESLFSCKILCFCFIGLCKSQHSIKFKIYQISTALSLIAVAALLICNLFSGLKEKTFKKFIHDCEFMVYDVFITLKLALVFVKLGKIKELVESLSDKSFGWDKKMYLEMRRRNYAKNLLLMMVLVIFESCGLISFMELPLFNEVQFPLDIKVPVNFNDYPKLFWIVYILICFIITFTVMMVIQIHHLSGCLFSYLSNEFEILGERYKILFDGLEDNIQNDKHELLGEIEKSLKENIIQHQKLLK